MFNTPGFEYLYFTVKLASAPQSETTELPSSLPANNPIALLVSLVTLNSLKLNVASFIVQFLISDFLFPVVVETPINPP